MFCSHLPFVFPFYSYVIELPELCTGLVTQCKTKYKYLLTWRKKLLNCALKLLFFITTQTEEITVHDHHFIWIYSWPHKRWQKYDNVIILTTNQNLSWGIWHHWKCNYLHYMTLRDCVQYTIAFWNHKEGWPFDKIHCLLVKVLFRSFLVTVFAWRMFAIQMSI